METNLTDNESSVESNEENTNDDDWRNGPAKYWYDLLKLPKDCKHYDYGLKVRTDSDLNENRLDSMPTNGCNDSEDAFNLVSQIKWEKDVIWDPDVVRQQVLRRLDKPTTAGWIPNDDNRKAPQFVTQTLITNKNINNINNSTNRVISNSNTTSNTNTNNTNNNVINNKIESKKLRNLRKRKCVENHEKSDNTLNNSQKSAEENTVITQWVSSLYEENKELVNSLWENNIIWDTEAVDHPMKPKVIPFSSNDDNMILEVPHILDEENTNDSQTAEEFTYCSHNFNISNDEFYASVSKADNNSSLNMFITHSVPALNISFSLFPTCVQNRNTFYRPLLKRSKSLISSTEHNVLFCSKQIKLKERLLESESLTLRDMSQYLIKSIKDLTACDGDIVLMEYAEEEPPLLMRVGMGSKIINYYKKKTKDKTIPQNSKYGETKNVINSLFIGELSDGQSQQALETNMFRSPIFEHDLPETDFLVIRSKDSYYIREFNALYVVGQQLPQIEVPNPRSKNFYNFIKKFSKMYIYRAFNKRKTFPNFDTMFQNAFSDLSKTMITRVLREYTERRGNQNRFALKNEIPNSDHFNNLVTPEEICTYYSATIAEKKFKDMGFGDRLYLDIDDNKCNNKEDKEELDELATAPWNTTVAYIASINAKKWLKLSNCNEDGTLVFSNQSYREFKDKMPAFIKCRPVSDLSLKRMTLKRAHEWLINYGMSKDKVKKLKNVFECNFLIKELSEKLRKGGLSCATKMSSTEQHYRFECQKVFDLHSSYYSSKEVYSTDDEEEEEECDSELEDMGKDLEAMLTQNKSLDEINYEREEMERLEFIKALKGDPNTENGKCKQSFDGKILKIIRKFENNGKVYTRTEIVRQTKVIEAYVRIRETKNENFIKQLSFVRNHAESGLPVTKSKSKSKPITSVKKTPNLSNGFTKAVTNAVESVQENCDTSAQPICIDNNNDNNSQQNDCNLSDSSVGENEPLVSVDGSKLKFSKQVMIDAMEIESNEKKKEKEELEAENKGVIIVDGYNITRKVTRCRIDPMVKLKDIFDKLIVEVRKLPELAESIDFFMEPVKKKEVPDYYDIIKQPIDLMAIRRKVNNGRYSNRKEFLADVELIYNNSLEYSGSIDQLTIDAKKMFEYCSQKLERDSEEIEKLEKMLSPQLS